MVLLSGYLPMKTIFLLIPFIIIPILIPGNIVGQAVCFEIDNRLDLPPVIYEKLKDSKAILIGELHGTNESPEYVEGMVDLWLKKGRKVILGLEIDGSEQIKVDSFLSSGDFSIIKKSPFFNRQYKDGRSSGAMGELIKSCYGKSNLKIICIDIANSRKAMNRDSMMAVCIKNTIKSNPESAMITLTGNVHNKLDSNKFGKTMGYWMYKMPFPVLNQKEIALVDAVFDKGAAWCCQPDCGIHNEFATPAWVTDECNYENFVRFYSNGAVILFTKTVTASLPLNP
jgi:hypothetical protein